MSHLETVYLDDLDGFEFEKLCQRIFEKSGWGKVERIGGVADGGRDLVIHRPQGQDIIVECKHQPNTSVGRPIVQKLHSAVISSGAIQGIIITTGKYSSEAIEHAKLLSKTIPIKLFDSHHLTDLAQKSGISLVTRSGTSTIFCFPVSNIQEIKNKLSEKIDFIQSYPKSARSLLKIISSDFLLGSYYLIKADIDQDFSTGVGLIHSIHKHDIYFIFDAQTGAMMNHDDASFLLGSSLISSSQIPTTTHPNKRANFSLDVTSLKDIVTKQLIQKYATNVSYTGRNNQNYQKKCVPNAKNICFNDIKQVLLPKHSLILAFLKNQYSCLIIQNNQEIKINSPDLYDCKICDKHIDQKVLLCNTCGNMTHMPKFFRSHSHICTNCKKTLCKKCTLQIRRFLFFKKNLCDECVISKSKSSKRIILDHPCSHCTYKNRQNANFCLKCGKSLKQ